MNDEDIRFFDVVAVLSRHIDEMHIKVGKIGSLVSQYRGLPSNKLDIKACLSGRNLCSYGISGSNEQGYRVRFVDRPLAVSKLQLLPESYAPRSSEPHNSPYGNAGPLSPSASALHGAVPQDEAALSSKTPNSFSGLSQSKVLPIGSQTMKGYGFGSTPPPFVFSPLPESKPLVMKINSREYASVVFSSSGAICINGSTLQLKLLANPCPHSVLAEDAPGCWRCVKCSSLFGQTTPQVEDF